MKNLLICCLVLLSCKTQQIANSREDIMKEPFIYDFKMTYFAKLLIEGFNHSKEIKKVISSDRMGYSEIILSMEDYALIDSLVKVDNRRMVQDSLQSIGRVAEGAAGKRVFDFVLYRYQSKWLDSLANERYRRQHINRNY